MQYCNEYIPPRFLSVQSFTITILNNSIYCVSQCFLFKSLQLHDQFDYPYLNRKASNNTENAYHGSLKYVIFLTLSIHFCYDKIHLQCDWE